MLASCYRAASVGAGSHSSGQRSKRGWRRGRWRLKQIMKFTVCRSTHQAPLAPGGSAVVEVSLGAALPDGAIFTEVIEAGDGSGGALTTNTVHAMPGAKALAVKVSNVGESTSDRYVVCVMLVGLGSGAIA
jgi:hypothetical protein